MLENFTAILIFVGVIVGIIGGTWNSTNRGVRKITRTGWATILVAFLLLLINILSNIEATRSERIKEERDTKIARDVEANRAMLTNISSEKADLLKAARAEGVSQALIEKIEALPTVVLTDATGLRFPAAGSGLSEEAKVVLRELAQDLNESGINSIEHELIVVGRTDPVPFAPRVSRLDAELARFLEDGTQIDDSAPASNVELGLMRALEVELFLKKVFQQFPSLRDMKVQATSGVPSPQRQMEIRVVGRTR